MIDLKLSISEKRVHNIGATQKDFKRILLLTRPCLGGRVIFRGPGSIRLRAPAPTRPAPSTSFTSSITSSSNAGMALSACGTHRPDLPHADPLAHRSSVDSRNIPWVGPLRSRRSEALSWAKPIPSVPGVPIRQHGMRGDGCHSKWNNIDQASYTQVQ